MIKGTELFVKALKEEGVDTLFGYPGGQAIDLFDALYDRMILKSFCQDMSRHLSMRQTDMQGQQERQVCALSQADRVQQTL